MDEGRAAIGVWLPLALGTIAAVVMNALRGEKDPPRRLSQVLRSFALPTLAAAVEKEEGEAEQDALLKGFEQLKARFGNGKGDASKDNGQGR